MILLLLSYHNAYKIDTNAPIYIYTFIRVGPIKHWNNIRSTEAIATTKTYTFYMSIVMFHLVLKYFFQTIIYVSTAIIVECSLSSICRFAYDTSTNSRMCGFIFTNVFYHVYVCDAIRQVNHHVHNQFFFCGNNWACERSYQGLGMNGTKKIWSNQRLLNMKIKQNSSQKLYDKCSW